MSVERRTLPQRRRCETFAVDVEAMKSPMIVTIGYYDDGSVGEVFVAGTKSGTAFDTLARDCAVLLSIAIQYGIPLAPIGHAMSRSSNGAPSSVMGVLIDRLVADDKGGQ